MKKDKKRPRPASKKSIREAKTDWDFLEALEMQHDAAERKRKLAGPSPEAQKMLNKKPKGSQK